MRKLLLLGLLLAGVTSAEAQTVYLGAYYEAAHKIVLPTASQCLVYIQAPYYGWMANGCQTDYQTAKIKNIASNGDRAGKFALIAQTPEARATLILGQEYVTYDENWSTNQTAKFFRISEGSYTNKP